jgi:hypothetical protein
VAARHELAVFADEEGDDAGDVVGAAEAVEGSLFLELGQLLLAPAVLVAGGLDDAGVDGVDADVEGPEFFGGGEGNATEGELAGAVRDEVGEAAQTGNGGADDDGAAADGGLHGRSSVLDAEEGWGSGQWSVVQVKKREGAYQTWR